MPKAVLWDFGNVIVRWNPRTLYEKIFPDPVECDRFLTQVCTLAWHTPTDCGVTFAENCAALAARHPHHEAEIWAWHRRWDEMFSGAIAETEAAMEALHARGVPQYGLSNISHETLHSTLAMSPAFGMRRASGSALLGFEARVGLVDDVDPALAAHELAVAVTRLERLERASDLHGTVSSSGPRTAGWRTRARAYTGRPWPSQPERRLRRLLHVLTPI